MDKMRLVEGEIVSTKGFGNKPINTIKTQAGNNI